MNQSSDNAIASSRLIPREGNTKADLGSILHRFPPELTLLIGEKIPLFERRRTIGKLGQASRTARTVWDQAFQQAAILPVSSGWTHHFLDKISQYQYKHTTTLILTELPPPHLMRYLQERRQGIDSIQPLIPSISHALLSAGVWDHLVQYHLFAAFPARTYGDTINSSTQNVEPSETLSAFGFLIQPHTICIETRGGKLDRADLRCLDSELICSMIRGMSKRLTHVNVHASKSRCGFEIRDIKVERGLKTTRTLDMGEEFQKFHDLMQKESDSASRLEACRAFANDLSTAINGGDCRTQDTPPIASDHQTIVTGINRDQLHKYFPRQVNTSTGQLVGDLLPWTRTAQDPCIILESMSCPDCGVKCDGESKPWVGYDELHARRRAEQSGNQALLESRM